MNTPKEIAEKFYSSFQKRAAESMCTLYSDNVHFSDPVFPSLVGEEAKDMWRMLCQTGKDLKVEYRILASTDKVAVVEWHAWYTFSKSGKKVHNKVVATLEIEDGLIIRHKDHFSFWRWSRQALGAPGIILGWTPYLQKQVQNTAQSTLRKFAQKA